MKVVHKVPNARQSHTLGQGVIYVDDILASTCSSSGCVKVCKQKSCACTEVGIVWG